MSEVNQRTQPDAAGVRKKRKCIEGFGRFVSDLCFVWERAKSLRGWRDFFQCLGVLLVGPLVGLFEWISIAADGVKVAAIHARRLSFTTALVRRPPR